MQRILESNRGNCRRIVMKTRLGVVEDQIEGMLGGKRVLLPIGVLSTISKSEVQMKITHTILGTQTKLNLDLICLEQDFLDTIQNGTKPYISRVINERLDSQDTIIFEITCSGK